MTNVNQPSDRHMVAQIWPCLLAAALGLVPFTLFSTFLVDIAADAQQDPAVIGGLRGLGGISALITGIICAPFIDRFPRKMVALAALIMMAFACGLGALSQTWSWVIFCLLIGAGTATLNPATSAAASDTFDDDATAGRAATLVSSTMTLTAMLAAPILALPALLWGWRGNLLTAAAACLIIGVVQYKRCPSGGQQPAATENSPGYLRSLQIVTRLPGALPLLGASTARTAAFMGQLAFIAVFYHQSFSLEAGVFTLVWSLSGLSFFLGNWFGGKVMRGVDSARRIALITALAAAVGIASIVTLFLSPALILSLAMTSTTAVAHAIIAAGVTTLLVRTAGSSRGTVLSLNGAGQSLGTFGGASLAGFGLGLGGWSGVAAVLGGVTALASLLCLAAAHSFRTTPEQQSG